MRRGRFRVALLLGLLLDGGLVVYVIAVRTPPGSRSLRVFDAERLIAG